jgi:hypothetical protein
LQPLLGGVRIDGTAEYLLTVIQNIQFFLPHYYNALFAGLLLLIYSIKYLKYTCMKVSIVTLLHYEVGTCAINSDTPLVPLVFRLPIRLTAPKTLH